MGVLDKIYDSVRYVCDAHEEKHSDIIVRSLEDAQALIDEELEIVRENILKELKSKYYYPNGEPINGDVDLEGETDRLFSLVIGKMGDIEVYDNVMRFDFYEDIEALRNGKPVSVSSGRVKTEGVTFLLDNGEVTGVSVLFTSQDTMYKKVFETNEDFEQCDAQIIAGGRNWDDYMLRFEGHLQNICRSEILKVSSIN